MIASASRLYFALLLAKLLQSVSTSWFQAPELITTLLLFAERLDTPYHWSDEQLAELQYPKMVQQVQQQRKEWRQLYDELVASSPGLPIATDAGKNLTLS